MVEPLLHRALMVVLLGWTVFGCAAPPPEKPITLRRPSTERRTLRPPAPRRPATATPAMPAVEAPDPTLTPDQKADLFRQFDRYLAKPEQ